MSEIIHFRGGSPLPPPRLPGLAFGFGWPRPPTGTGDRSPEDKELVAVVENDSCAVDAIQVLTGCTFGKGNLIFRDHGKHVYTFFKRTSGEALRVMRWSGVGNPRRKLADAGRLGKIQLRPTICGGGVALVQSFARSRRSAGGA